MGKRNLSLLAFTVIGLNLLFGGEKPVSPTHSLSLSASFLNPNFSDYLVSPFHHHGLGAGGEISYALQTSRFTLNAAVKGGGGGLLSGNSKSIEDGRNIFIDAAFSIDTAYRLPIFKDRGHLLIGLQTGYQLQCFFLRHIDSYDWAGDLSFLPLIGLEYDFGKSLLSSSLVFSLFSVINRPPWTIYDDELDMMVSKSLLSILFRGEPAFVDRYFRITWKIHWDARLSPHLRLITGGALQCIRTTEPQDAVFFSSSVEVGIRYVF